MKFWMLMSVLRGQSAAIGAVLMDRRWARYADWVAQYARYVNEQDRGVLDAEVDDDLTRALLARSSIEYVVQDGWLHEYTGREKGATVLSAIEVWKRYGGEALEEVKEYGSCKVPTPYPKAEE